MATIIPCENIEQEVDILLQKFRACYKPTAEDLDQLSNLVYSASLCGTGEGSIPTFDQNNLFPVKSTAQNTIRINDPATAINALPQFVVDEKEIMIFYHTRTIESDDLQTIFRNEYYVLRTGKGTYGAGGTAITNNNLLLIRFTESTLGTPPGSTSPPRVLNLYADSTGGATISTPHTILNNLDELITITDSQDTYFAVYETEAALEPGAYNLYRFIGAAGDYGNGPDDSIIGDFLLIDTIDPSDDNNTSNGQIKIREINVPAIIDPNGTFTTLSAAINGSFNQQINASANEIVIFIADFVSEEPVLTPTETINIVTQKWAWKNGEATSINTGSTDDDFVLIETVGTTTVNTPGGVNPAAVYYVQWNDVTDVNDAVDAVNSLSGADRVVLNDNLVLVKVSLDDGTNNYKLWEFTGAVGGNGTYGVAGSTAVAGDFNGTPVADGTEFDGVIKASNVLYDDTVTNLGVFNVQEAIEALDTAIDAAVSPTGLEAINEGNGIGWRLIGRNPANYGNIGANSVDFSNSTVTSTVNGVRGNTSISAGTNNRVDTDGSAVFGSDNVSLEGTYSAADFLSGFQNTSYEWTSGTINVGYLNKLGTSGSTGSSNPVGYYSGALGYSNNIYGGRGTFGLGAGLLHGGAFCTVVGAANVDLTAATANQFWAQSNNLSNPAFIVGVGDVNSSSSANPTFTRRNGFVVWRDGTAELPEATIAEIDTRGNKAVTTVEWVNANASPTGLEAINEGNGIGWRLIGRDPANYGNIGNGAVDFSLSTGASSDRGAIGNFSFVAGEDNEVKGDNETVFGWNNRSMPDTSGTGFVYGNTILGLENKTYKGTQGVLVNGRYSSAGILNNNGGAGDPRAWYGISSGFGNDLYAGSGSHLFGAALTSGAAGATVVGIANIDRTVLPANQNQAGSWFRADYGNALFIVGNGTANAVDPPDTSGPWGRSNAFEVYHSGNAVFPDVDTGVTVTNGVDDTIVLVVDEGSNALSGNAINAGITLDDQGEGNQASIGLTTADEFEISSDAFTLIETNGSTSDMRIRTANNGNNIFFDAGNFGAIRVDMQSGGWFVYDATPTEIDSGPDITVATKQYVEETTTKVVRRTFTPAEILALDTTAIEIIPASLVGANQYCLILGVTTKVTGGTTDYDGGNLTLRFTDGVTDSGFGTVATVSNVAPYVTHDPIHQSGQHTGSIGNLGEGFEFFSSNAITTGDRDVEITVEYVLV